MRDNKVIVTGGAGFIGGHLVKNIAKDNEVLVIDDLSEGKRQNICDNADFLEMDIRDKDKIKNIFRKFDPDAVFHLAAHNDAIGSIDEPSKTVDINVKGTVNLLEACRNRDIRKFVYASSGGLSYGEPEQTPTTEAEKLDPVYPYGVSKTCGSLFISDYGRRYGIDFAVMRLGSVYGPGANGGVIKNFFQRLKSGQRPIIYGDGSQSRDFIHVSDVVRGLIAGYEKGSGFYNLGSETQTTVNELIKKIETLIDSELDPIYEGRWPGDIDRCELSTGKAEQELEWRPEIGLEQGLKTCRDYYMGD